MHTLQSLCNIHLPINKKPITGVLMEKHSMEMNVVQRETAAIVYLQFSSGVEPFQASYGVLTVQG